MFFVSQRWLPEPGVSEPLLVRPDHEGRHRGAGAGVPGPESPSSEGLHSGTKARIWSACSSCCGSHLGTVMFSHLGSIPLSFPPSAQLEDEALKHIQHHCHELVSLNLQSCSVSMDPGACAQPHCPSCPRPTACRTGAPAAPVPPLPATPACSPIVWPHMPKVAGK